MEVAKNILALDLFSDEAELAEAPLGISLILEISQGDLKHTTLQTLRGNF